MLGRDKYDRPVVYCRTRDLRMGDSQPDHQCVLLMFIMDYCMSIMPPHADQMVFVFDVQDFGYAQFYIEPLKKVLHVTRNTGHGEDIEKMKKIILGTTRPENVRSIVSKFEKEILGTKFLTLHWRYDMKDWYVHCKRDKNQNIPPDAPCRLVMK